MGVFSKIMGGRKSEVENAGHRKQVSMSSSHEHKQVLGFNDSSNDGTKPSDLGRELLAFPKPEKKETMADYLSNHKEGDIFPYVAVTGQQNETKDSRMARLRAFVSPYGKSVIPDMRVNGVVLELPVGSIGIVDLKRHVDQSRLTSKQKKENSKSRDLNEHVFKKPYLQIQRITGEFVPLLSGTADYTDLQFSLYDGRLLDNQVLVQSNKLPTNSTGVFEMTCDYSIPTRDIDQLSLKYELARSIMRDGFQWGAVSLVISVCESDTPYLTPKVEAMAIVKTPYTALEDQTTDPDHKDVTYTASQIKHFKNLYTQGDIADNDEPLKQRLQISSYSKSTIRGVQKAVKGSDHLGKLDGWSQLQGLKKPLLEQGVASVATPSEEGSADATPFVSREQWEAQQKAMRATLEEHGVKGIVDNPFAARKAIEPGRIISPSGSSTYRPTSAETDDDDDEPEIMKKMRRKSVGFEVHDV